MSAAAGRGDRRRRILSEGRLTLAAIEEISSDDQPRSATPQRRYAPGPGSVSFGVARRLLPTTGGALAGFLLAGLFVGGGLIATHLYQDKIAASLGESSDAQTNLRPILDVARPTSLLAWVTTTLTLATAALCVIVFGLRRHRSDDLRGVYRWWMPAAVVCLAASVCQATGLHNALATVIAINVGWTALPGSAIWWLLPTLLIATPLAVRVIIDLKESRLALSAALLAAACFGVALVAKLGGTPAAWAASGTVIVAGALHLGLLATLLSQLAYTRRILQEAGGQIAPPAKAKLVASSTAESQQAERESQEVKPVAVGTSNHLETKRRSDRVSPQEPPRVAAETQWVDGSQADYQDAYEDEGDGATRRKLSKSERKRLRKQKARGNRAA